MTTFAERVEQASADWVFVPPDARSRVGDEYSLVAYPEHWTPPTQLFRIRSARPFPDLRDEIGAIAREWGRTEVGWWVGPGTRPSDLEDGLRAAGARPDLTVAVFGYDLTAGLPDTGAPGGVIATIVRDRAGFLDFAAVNQQLWGAPPPDQAQLERFAGQLETHEFRAVAYDRATPIACAGVSLVGPVARLWGGATLAEQRGRGAYRSLLATRLATARGLGATLALVKGVVTTSAPILRRVGFAEFGEERCYLLDVTCS